MLSKLLTGAAGSAAAHLTWPSAGAGAPAAWEPPRRPEDVTAQPSPDARRIAELEQHAERRARESREAGRREGEAAGRSQATAELQPVLEKLARSIQEIAALRPQIAREATAELVELSVGIARRILHRELSVDPAALEGLVRVALEKLGGQEICRVRVHPELEPGIRQALARAGRAGLPLAADGTLERGAILIDTARGRLDASIEVQLAEIGRGLADRLPDK